MLIKIPEYRPDISDYNGESTLVVQNVVPRADGYGPVKALNAYSSALPAACRGYFFARNTDGTIAIFAATANRVFLMDNTALGWIPVSKVVALTSISNGSPAVFTLNSHGLANGDTLRLTTSGGLPTGLSAGVTYFVINQAANTFNVSLTLAGAAVNTSGAGSGTHSMTYKYSDVPSTDQWQFAQFGSFVVAVQANTVPQVFTLGTSPAFADLGGSPPTARYAAVIGRFLALTGLTANPRRIHWSAIDDITGWTPGTAFSLTVDLPDGGVARGVAGGEFGLLFQESVIRRLVYVPGAAVAFQIERIAEDIGLLGAYSIIRANGAIFFYSSKGFIKYAGGALLPIGNEKIDRTFKAEFDLGNLQLLIGASDPEGTRVFWAYKTGSNPNSTFNKMLCYSDAFDRWTPIISATGEYLASIVKPGVTLDGLDSIAGSIDALTFSLDSVSSGVSASLSAFNTSHQLSLFDGQNVEAILDTPELAIDMGRRVRIRSLRPISDAATVYGSIKSRSTQQATASTSSEVPVNSNGVCPFDIGTRYARGRMRIPAAQTWTYAIGVEPDFKQAGKQ